jgi:predicted ester cyclase
MATERPQATRNEELVREMSEAIWGADGSPEAVDDYFAADVIDHEPGETIEGRAAYKEYERALREGMPDLAGVTELVICEDDLVAVRYTATGTHTGELWGIEPTGERGEVTGQVIYRIEDGRVTECWHEYDRLGMMQQLGLIPENPAA